MLLILFLPYHFALKYSGTQFVTRGDITKGLLNLKLDKIIISTSKICSTVKLLKYNQSKVCSELYITGKEHISCTRISRVM